MGSITNEKLDQANCGYIIALNTHIQNRVKRENYFD